MARTAASNGCSSGVPEKVIPQTLDATTDSHPAPNPLLHKGNDDLLTSRSGTTHEPTAT